MIGISSVSYDPNGFVMLKEDVNTSIPVFSRRVSKTATLDGNSVVSDLGYSASDGDFSVEVSNISKEEIDTLIYLIKTYSVLRLSSNIGSFEVSMSRLNTNSIPILIDFLIIKEI